MSKYRYSQRIGRGGMADVFLGMQEGLGGFEKLVVIKRIFQQYCEDERFLQMFMDEARLAASIRHPNVVEILDIDRDATGFFIVMEYLSGETLGYVIPTLQERDELPPPQVVCRIGASVAAGLHDAHTATDAVGAPQPIVHRDVTPSNILVCYNGVVKLLDFGVAKAVLGEGETRVRGVKGKLSYLAPEQLANEPVDARADIFQLGIVLHELLTGRGLFHASNAHARIMAVMDREIPPPSRLHPDVPRILDEIVLAALERDPEKRLQSAEEMHARLEEAIQVMGAPAGGREVGAWMRESFAEAYARRLALERSTASQIRQSRQLVSLPPPPDASFPSWTPGNEGSQPSQPGAGSGAHGSGPHPGSGSHPGSGPHPGGGSYPGSGSHPGGGSHPGMSGGSEPSTMTMAADSLPAQRSLDGRRRAWLLASVLLLVVTVSTGVALTIADGSAEDGRRAATASRPAAGEPGDSSATPAGEGPAVSPGEAAAAPAGASAAGPEEPAPGAGAEAPEPETAPAAPEEPAGTFLVEVETSPAHAIIELDGTAVGRGSLSREFPMDGSSHVLVVSADGYRPRVITFRDEFPARRVQLERLERRAGRGAARDRRRRRSRRSRSTPPPATREASGGSQEARSQPATEAPAPSETRPAESEPEPPAAERRPEPARPATDNLDPWGE